VRCVEEPYLIRVHGDAYRSYARAVGRFLPGIGRGVLLMRLRLELLAQKKYSNGLLELRNPRSDVAGIGDERK
jgi:hypothetical protein